MVDNHDDSQAIKHEHMAFAGFFEHNLVMPDTSMHAAGKPRQRNQKTATAQAATPRQPRQQRAAFTVAAIIEAARELLLKHGAEAVTTRQVAARAGVAVGTLYQYFPDRDAILLELARQIMDEEVDHTAHQLATLYRQPLAELMGALYAHSVDIERRMQALGGGFHQRYARHLNFGLTLKDKISRSPQDSAALLSSATRMLSDHRQEVAENDRDLAAFMIVRGLRSLMISLVEERPDLLTSNSLAPMLTRMALAICASSQNPASTSSAS